MQPADYKPTERSGQQKNNLQPMYVYTKRFLSSSGVEPLTSGHMRQLLKPLGQRGNLVSDTPFIIFKSKERKQTAVYLQVITKLTLKKGIAVDFAVIHESNPES